MAILVAGIGLVAVMTLFPAAVLRTAQAVQLTNATLLRYNAEAVVDTLPELIDDPDGDVSTPAQNQDPLDPRTRRRGGHSPYVEHFGERFIVDPIGWWMVAKDHLQQQPDLRVWFGNTGGQPVKVLRRYNAGLNPVDWSSLKPDRTAEAFSLAGLPDSWVLQWQGTPETITAAGNQELVVGLPMEFDMSSLQGTVSRVVLLDMANGRSGQVCPVVQVDAATNTIQCSPVAQQLLQNVSRGQSGVEQVRVETLTHRYTWLLTVRKNGFGDANIDVVVFYNRTFSAEDERAYPATFIAGSDKVGVKTGGAETFVRKGGFVLDLLNARWYRVLDFVENQPGYDLILTIDRTAIENAGKDADLDGQVSQAERSRRAGPDFGFAVLMRGVVEVYPIAPKRFPQELLETLIAP